MRHALFALIIFVITASAQAKYSGGTGEPNTPYQIAIAADLMTLANDANDYNKCFIMTHNIDLDPNLPGNQTFTTAVIARDINSVNSVFDGNVFSGVFDGAGHNIANITINNCYDYVGLFGNVKAGIIKNLNIENMIIIGGRFNVGGLIGYNAGDINNCRVEGITINGDISSAGGLIGDSNGNISNCHVEGASIVSNNGYHIGGLAGYSRGSISNCSFTGAISGWNTIGGVVGESYGCIISNCCTKGTITGIENTNYMGGIAAVQSHSASISDCNSSMVINGGNGTWRAGGIVGENYSSVSNCRSDGDINCGNSSQYIGGLLGENYNSINNCDSSGSVTCKNDSWYIGGLIGYNRTADITNCSAAGKVTSGSTSSIGADIRFRVGGLIGYNEGNISHCHATGNVAFGNGLYKICYIGGLIGENGGSISYCYATGNVTGGENATALGGLLGQSSGIVTDSYATGNITGGNGSYQGGGLIGANQSGVVRCYAYGDVNTVHWTGGFLGSNGAPISNCYSKGNVVGSSQIGGLIGYNSAANITNNYSTGNVSGSTNVGGFIGYSQGTTVSCYFLDANSGGGPNNGYGTPLNDIQMKQQASFASWDFDANWAICEGTNYPRLIWQIPAADFICPDGVTFFDYTFFAERWLNTSCAADSNCDGTDFDSSGTVDMADLEVFCDYWLQGL